MNKHEDRGKTKSELYLLKHARAQTMELGIRPTNTKIKRPIIQIKLDRNRNIGQSNDRNASGLWSMQSWSVYMCSCHYSSYGIWSVSFYVNINTEKQSETQWVITPPCDLHAAVRYDKISSWHACCHVWYVGSSWAWYYIREEKKAKSFLSEKLLKE